MLVIVTAPRGVTLRDPAHRPSRKAPLVWALSAAIPWAFAAVGLVVWMVLSSELSWLHAVAAAAIVVGAVVFVGVAPVWRYRVHRWEISPRAVFTRTGWVSQEHRIVPITRVQTVDTYRGPLDRLFGLANLTVTTASQAGTVRIVALDSEVAEQVAAQLTDIAALGPGDAT
jgi:membrane protein YdbS with pleckstrin-like domain